MTVQVGMKTSYHDIPGYTGIYEIVWSCPGGGDSRWLAPDRDRHCRAGWPGIPSHLHGLTAHAGRSRRSRRAPAGPAGPGPPAGRGRPPPGAAETAGPEPTRSLSLPGSGWLGHWHPARRPRDCQARLSIGAARRGPARPRAGRTGDTRAAGPARARAAAQPGALRLLQPRQYFQRMC